jgi:small conductance mechanosensitive channel
MNVVTTWLIKILIAIAIVIVGRWASKFVTHLVKKALTKANVDETLTKFLGDITYVGLLILVFISALGTLGVSTTSFAAVLGAASLAIGLALQSNFSNFGAGALILLLRPFKVGDFVETAGISGVVESIGMFNTTFKTGDNRIILVPNSSIIGSNIINYSKEPIRRIDLVIGIGYDDDIKLAKEILEKILKENEKVLDDPAPSVAIAELADSSVNFNVRPWVKREDYWGVRSEILEKIKEEFDKHGINIPYPQLDVHLKKED